MGDALCLQGAPHQAQAARAINCDIIGLNGKDSPSLRSNLSLLQRRAEGRFRGEGRYITYRPDQAKDLCRH